MDWHAFRWDRQFVSLPGHQEEEEQAESRSVFTLKLNFGGISRFFITASVLFQLFGNVAPVCIINQTFSRCKLNFENTQRNFWYNSNLEMGDIVTLHYILAGTLGALFQPGARGGSPHLLSYASETYVLNRGRKYVSKNSVSPKKSA